MIDEPVDTKNLHKKPTKEELQENINAAIEDMEEETPETPETVEEESQEDEEVIEETPEEEQPEEEEKVETIEPEEEKDDYKEKFVQSSKEAMILHHQNKKANEAIDSAINTPEPTEEDLQAEYDDWDVMSDFEKKMAKQTLWNDRRFAQLETMQKENKNLQEWGDKIEEFIGDPKNLSDFPQLEGKQEEFKLFASRPTRMNSDFDLLVGAFLYEGTKNPPKKNKGAMFDNGTGGANNKPQPKAKLSLEESRNLMNTDYEKWKTLLRQGKITTSV